jgi:hypothetical protein
MNTVYYMTNMMHFAKYSILFNCAATLTKIVNALLRMLTPNSLQNIERSLEC